MHKQTRELNRYNNEQDKKLSKENDLIMTDMICYLRGANISEHNQELVRQDLLEMVISAQQRGEDIRTVIGIDYREFCDNIIASLPPEPMKKRLLELFDIILLCTPVFWVFNIGTLFVTRQIKGMEVWKQGLPITVGAVLSYVFSLFFAFLVFRILVQTSLKSETEKMKGKWRGHLKNFFLSAGFMAIFLFLAWIGKAVLFVVNIFIAAAFLLLIFIVHKIIDKKLLTKFQ